MFTVPTFTRQIIFVIGTSTLTNISTRASHRCDHVCHISMFATMVRTVHQQDPTSTLPSTTIANRFIAKLLAPLLRAPVLDCNQRRNCHLGARAYMDRHYRQGCIWSQVLYHWRVPSISTVPSSPSFIYNVRTLTFMSRNYWLAFSTIDVFKISSFW